MATSEMNYTLRHLGQVQGVKMKSLEQLVYLFDFKCITSGLIDLLQNVFTDVYCGGKIFMNLILAALLSGIKAAPSSPCLCWDFMPRMCSLSFICHAASCEPFKHLPLALPFCCDHTIC